MSSEAEKKEVTLLFTIGRMNPPTTLDIRLMEIMIENAIETNAVVAIILSHLHEKDKDILQNPLKCIDDKRNLVKDIIEELKKRMISKNKYKGKEEYIKKIVPIVICMNDEYKPNIFKSIGKLVSINKPTKMILYVSEDKDIIDLDYYKNIEKEIIKIPTERDNIKMVEYALSENKDAFVKNVVLHTGLDEKKSTELYKNLHKILHAQIEMIYHSSKSYNAFFKKMSKTNLEPEKIKELYDELEIKLPKTKTTRKKKTKLDEKQVQDISFLSSMDDDDEELFHNLYNQLEKEQEKKQDLYFLSSVDEKLLNKLYDELEKKQSTSPSTRKKKSAHEGGRRKRNHRKSKTIKKKRK